MVNDLKRVGLVFTEEGAVDFKKTLQDINIEMSKNYNQFKLTQAQWDSSTKSTEKLRAEQEYLKNAYEIQTDKVKTLKMQLSDLENAENKNTTAIKKKQNELTNAEIKLENYNKRLKEINTQLNNTGKKLEEWGKSAEKFGDKVEKAGKKVSAFSVATGTALLASAKNAIDFEDAFTGVEKTVDGTEEQMAELKQGIRDMAKEIPSTTTEIAGVAEAAGQLGIKTENILGFSKAMIDLGNATNLTADEAASNLAKFANIMQMSQSDFDKLGSSIVDLGNNFATTEADIVDMSMRLAGAGKQVGLSEGQVLGLATALSSVGIEAEMGGSAISKAMVKMQNAVELGGGKLNTVLKKTGKSLRELELMSANNSKDFKALADSIGMTSTELKQMITAGTNLEDFAKVSGMTAEQFKKSWKEDASGALTAFIKGLGDAESKGDSAITMLSEMGLTEVRLRDSLLRAANAGSLFNDAIETGTKAWEDNTALTNEANKRYGTLKSQIMMAVNKLKDFAITIGNKLMPSIQKVIDGFGKWIKKFEDLSDEEVDMIIKLGLIVTAAGPVITIFGKLTSVIGGTIKGIGTVTQAIGVMQGTVTTTSTAVNGLAKVFSAITSPAGIATIAITSLAAIIGATIIKAKEAEKQLNDSTKNIADGMTNYIEKVRNAENYLESFNSTLFASSNEQQELVNNMQQIQEGITEICRTATAERRDYTQKEIQQLDEYFTKLSELQQKQLSIQLEISKAISIQAQTALDSFNGTTEEYEVLQQRWVSTATEQRDTITKLIEDQTIQEIALLNQRFGDEANLQNEAYANEYANILAKKEKNIEQANEEVGKVSQIYSNYYTQQNLENENWFTKYKEYHNQLKEEDDRYINATEKATSSIWGALTQRLDETELHEKEMNKIWKRMTDDMTETEKNQLGEWLMMLAHTEAEGGKLESETQQIVDQIISDFDSMPAETKESMKNAMAPMLTEMENKEPSLYAKASGIANGILSRLKKAFDIHSPSKKTKAIFKNVMKRNGKRD